MDDLKTTLQRPLDRANMSNDTASLRALVGLLNNHEVTGAVVPAEEKNAVSNPPLNPPAAAPIPLTPPASLIGTPVKAKTLPNSGFVPGIGPGVAASLIPNRIFFTGNSKVGKSWLAAQMGARVFEFDDPIDSMAASAFGDVQEPALLNQFRAEIRAWGDGIVTNNHPLTAARAFFIEWIRGCNAKFFGCSLQEFGTPGFWAKSLIARVTAFQTEFPKERVVVTDVLLPDQYHALLPTFRAYHVTCNPLTRSSRGGGALTNPVADAVGRDLTQKISQSPTGSKLWCVWCDEKYPSPSARVLTVPEFLGQL